MKTIHELDGSIAEGGLDNAFHRLYPGGDAGLARRRYGELCRVFGERFGGDRAASLFSAPGRTEIGGNHTDHQHGCVLAGSVDLDIVAAASPNAEGVVRLHSEGFPESVVSLDDLEPNPEEFNQAGSLVRGITAQFVHRGFAVSGFDACMTSTVLKGSGLSSSAAFEIMIGTVLNHLFADATLLPVEIAKIGRHAENCYFGKPCGLMDQIACCVGGVQFIDFQDIDNPVIRKLPSDFRSHGLALCIVDSGADHADLTDEYSPIPREMGQVAGFFGKSVLRDVERDAFMADIPAIRKKTGDRAILRALHFFGENERTSLEAAALEAGDIPAFLGYVNASGRSSHMYLQNIFPSGDSRRQEVGLALGLCEELLAGRGAFRVHGGGFAGTVQAFVPLDMLDHFKINVDKTLGEGRCHVLSIRADGSVRLT